MPKHDKSIPKVFFICRGSVNDGLGHVIRSRTVALSMKEFANVVFIVIGDEYAGNLLNGRGLDYLMLDHAQQIGQYFHDFSPDVVILDTLHLNDAVFEKIRSNSIVVSLSPIFDSIEDVDLIFHRSSVLDPRWLAWHGGAEIRSGLQYSVVTRHCQRIDEVTYKNNLHISKLSVAIAMGGTDAANRTLQVLNRLAQIKSELLFWVMLGEGYAHSYKELSDSIKGSRHEIILAKTNDSMWRILSTCSLAILAGGITTYEAAYAGLPTVNTLDTSAKYFLIQELVEKQASAVAGLTIKESLQMLPSIISTLEDNRNQLLDMHRRSKDLLDSDGASRISCEIIAYYNDRVGD